MSYARDYKEKLHRNSVLWILKIVWLLAEKLRGAMNNLESFNNQLFPYASLLAESHAGFLNSVCSQNYHSPSIYFSYYQIFYLFLLIIIIILP